MPPALITGGSGPEETPDWPETERTIGQTKNISPPSLVATATSRCGGDFFWAGANFRARRTNPLILDALRE